jgi:hypothetical protein
MSTDKCLLWFQGQAVKEIRRLDLGDERSSTLRNVGKYLSVDIA